MRGTCKPNTHRPIKKKKASRLLKKKKKKKSLNLTSKQSPIPTNLMPLSLPHQSVSSLSLSLSLSSILSLFLSNQSSLYL